jgi:hypothetical protein
VYTALLTTRYNFSQVAIQWTVKEMARFLAVQQ